MLSIHQTEYLRYNATTNTIYREDTTEEISEVIHEQTSIIIIRWKKTVEKNNILSMFWKENKCPGEMVRVHD